MPEVVWKNIVWKSAYGDLPIKDILTILKGYGPMEILAFEWPDLFKGELSISLDKNGIKHVTIFWLEIIGEKKRGIGRFALAYLRKIFESQVHVEDAGYFHVKNVTRESLLFWIKMFEEGIIQSLVSDDIKINECSTYLEIKRAKEKLVGELKNKGKECCCRCSS